MILKRFEHVTSTILFLFELSLFPSKVIPKTIR